MRACKKLFHRLYNRSKTSFRRSCLAQDLEGWEDPFGAVQIKRGTAVGCALNRLLQRPVRIQEI